MVEIGSCEWCGEFCADENMDLAVIHLNLLERPTNEVLLKREQVVRARGERPAPPTAAERAAHARQVRIERAPAAIRAAADLEAKRQIGLDAVAGRFNRSYGAYSRGGAWRRYYDEEALRLLDLRR